MEILLLILGIIMFVGLVVVHEFGHFVSARNNGVEAEEFGIGFPPRAWGRKIKSKKGDFLFSINWLPLGGFVKLKGEHDSDTAKGTFGAASTWVKTKIMAAGVFMNLVTALVLFMIVAVIGMPQIIGNQFTVASDTRVSKEGDVRVGNLVKDSPAAKAGIKLDDRVLTIAGKPVGSPAGLMALTQANAGKSVDVVTENGKGTKTTAVKLNETSPYLGVGSYVGSGGLRTHHSTWSAPIVALGVTWDLTVASFKALGVAVQGLGSIIAGAVTGNHEARKAGQTAASSQVSGPVGIFAVLKAGAAQGIGFILFVVGVISLSLAIMNILPIPALDGGKLAITYVSRLFGKRVSESFESYAYGISFLMLIGLMVVITIVDVKRFF